MLISWKELFLEVRKNLEKTTENESNFTKIPFL